MVAVLNAIVDHLILPWPLPLRIAYVAWSLVSLYAVVRFCDAMRIFCFSAGLLETEATWITSERLVLWLVLVPVAGMQVLALIGGVSRGRESSGLFPLAVAVVVAAAIALIHFLLSIARTRTALRDATNGRFLP